MRKRARWSRISRGQWLQFRNIDVVRPDGERFPEFDESLRYSMRRETELFVENIVRHDGSVLDFLNADYSFLNERLARFYGIPGVTGPEFRRVDMSAHQARRRRSGAGQHPHDLFLFHAHLAGAARQVDSRESAERSSAAAAALRAGAGRYEGRAVGVAAAADGGASRERRRAPSAIRRWTRSGFGLENLNAIGAWRDEDGKFPVDASGVAARRPALSRAPRS